MSARGESEPITAVAHRLVSGQRGKDYGHPSEDFARIGALWAPILGVEVTPRQVALCMIQVKVGRLCNTPTHLDSLIDIAGYAETIDMINQREADPG